MFGGATAAGVAAVAAIRGTARAAVASSEDTVIYDTVSDLRSAPVPTEKLAYLRGYHSVDDGGGGWLIRTDGVDGDDAISIFTEDANAGSPGRWERPLGTNEVNVRWGGAIGDGVTADDDAIKRALALAYSLSSSLTVGASHAVNRSLYFPPGVYRVTENNIFGSVPGLGNLTGVTIRGGSRTSTTVIADPVDGEFWFYDKLDQRYLMALTVKDIHFEGVRDFSGIINGFRWGDTGHAKSFRFIDCDFTHLDNLFETGGVGTAAENTFVRLQMHHIRGTKLRINNPQSVVHRFTDPVDYNSLGHFIEVGPSGGGEVMIEGGSLVMQDGYLLKIDAGPATVGTKNCRFRFNNVKVESRETGNRDFDVSGLYEFGGTESNNQVDVVFSNCNFSAFTGGERPMVRAKRRNTIKFVNCLMPQIGSYELDTSSGSAHGNNSLSDQHGSVQFLGCAVPWDIHARYVQSGNWGYCRVRGCHLHGSGAMQVLSDFVDAHSSLGANRKVVWAGDWESSGYRHLTDAAVSVHRVSLNVVPNFPVPGITGDLVVVFPPNVSVVGGRVVKHGDGVGSGNHYRLEVRRHDDPDTQLLRGNRGQEKHPHYLEWTGSDHRIGTAEKGRIWTIGGTLEVGVRGEINRIDGYLDYRSVPSWADSPSTPATAKSTTGRIISTHSADSARESTAWGDVMDGGVFLLCGYGSTPGDGLGGVYQWHRTSTDSDDSTFHTVLQPTESFAASEGRWIRIAGL